MRVQSKLVSKFDVFPSLHTFNDAVIDLVELVPFGENSSQDILEIFGRNAHQIKNCIMSLLLRLLSLLLGISDQQIADVRLQL